ncbi:hypothetical protein EAF04_009444 [Stromatinia cepivora]|nr:hypothetical protein EAF04_009444 [Stromatinia cepivora]
MPVDISINPRNKREEGERFWKGRENAYPNADALDEAFTEAFTEAIAHFEQTKLYDRLKTLTKILCEDKKFDKIVAFGGNTLGHEQQTHRKTKDDFKIYLQDPLYDKNDLEVAKRHGMTIYGAGKTEKELGTFTDPPSLMEGLFAYTLASNGIRVPYYGLSEPVFKDWAKEYELKDLDKKDLVVGVVPPPCTKAEADGENGRCYLGSTGPILLRRST